MFSKLLLNRKKIMFILAIGAGALLCSPSVHALPQQEGYVTPGVNINIITAEKSMNITASANNNNNNVINWSSFNIGESETVNFNDSNNYLNLIHDSNASKINGTIRGGNNVYLINPNGILFGANSNVNVGNLYVSTRPLDGNDFDDYVNSDGFLNATTNLTGDIVNLGKMQATQVVLEGSNVTLKNGAKIKETSDNVIINAANAIEIGNLGNLSTTGWKYKSLTDFKLISTFDELKNMQSGMNYMLADDIDAKNMLWNGIGHYYGKFNGLNHKISNLLIGGENTTRSHISIFGDLHGIVKNVSVVNSKFYGVEDVGSLVGYMYKDAVVDNCHSIGCEVHGTEFVGGIAGATKGGSIVDCVNNAYVDGWNCVGGIVGIADSGDFTLKNSINNGHVYCHNDPTLQKYRHDGHYENAHVGGLIGYAGDGVYPCIITNCINYGVVDGTTYVGGIAGSFNGGSIDSCKNFAGINGINNVGGITGACIGGLDYTLVFRNTNNGDVSGTEIVGGIVGMHLAGNIQGNNNIGNIYINGIRVSGHEVFGADWSRNEPMFGSETPTNPSNKPKQTQPMIDNAIYDGLMAADCLKPLISNDFQNFSKGSSLVGETIQDAFIENKQQLSWGPDNDDPE